MSNISSYIFFTEVRNSFLFSILLWIEYCFLAVCQTKYFLSIHITLFIRTEGAEDPNTNSAIKGRPALFFALGAANLPETQASASFESQSSGTALKYDIVLKTGDSEIPVCPIT